MHGFGQPQQQYPIEPDYPAGPEIMGQSGWEAMYNAAPRYQEPRKSLLLGIAVEWERRSAQVAVGLAQSGVSPTAGPSEC
jgi:hypothetical protein